MLIPGKKMLKAASRIATVTLVAFPLIACSQYKLKNDFEMPSPPTSGHPNYILGWQDGCKTGMTSYSTNYLRTKYHTSVKPQLMRTVEYAKGWELGQKYCSYYTSTYLSHKRDVLPVDLRENNTWFALKSDGFFEYDKGWGWGDLKW